MSRKARRAHLQPTERKAAMNVARPPQNEDIEADGIPVVSDLDCAFPTNWHQLLPKWDELTAEEKRMRGPFCDALSSLFFKGGRLSDHGITVKPGVDSDKVHRYIRATLGDFGPSHEHKIGGIAHMLKKWCDIDQNRAQ